MASLQEWQTFHQELASLARAGVPLDVGLTHLASSLPRRWGNFSARLAARLQAGHTLVEALRLEGGALPPSYLAVVEAALEAHRLPEVLDTLVSQGMVIQDLRRRITLALVYPLLVAVVAYLLFVLVLLPLPPLVWDALQVVPAQPLPATDEPLRGLYVRLADSVLWWGPVVPLMVWAMWRQVTGWVRSARGLSYETTRGVVSGLWFPGVAAVYQALEGYQAAALLQLLIGQQIPLPRALRLTAQTTPSPGLRAALTSLGREIEQGVPLQQAVERCANLPKLFAQLLTLGEREGRLSEALQQVATIYQRRARLRLDWLHAVLPPVLLVLLGGGVSLLYGLMLFWPLRQLWLSL